MSKILRGMLSKKVTIVVVVVVVIGLAVGLPLGVFRGEDGVKPSPPPASTTASPEPATEISTQKAIEKLQEALKIAPPLSENEMRKALAIEMLKKSRQYLEEKSRASVALAEASDNCQLATLLKQMAEDIRSATGRTDQLWSEARTLYEEALQTYPVGN